MNFWARSAILFCAVMMPALAIAAGTPMKEGLWEITSTMEMPGMPYQPPPTTFRHCYTREDLRDEKQVLPKQQGDCKVADMKRNGSRIAWKVTCTGEHKGTGEGEIIFRGDTAYEGSMKFAMDEMKMTSRYKARRIGACTQ
jgi:Protein of unknown function (DUF3617)